VSVHTANDILVLVIDDHEMFAVALSRFVAGEHDMQVVGPAHTAARGLELAASAHPSVVIVSFDTADGWGDATVRQLKAMNSGARVLALAEVNPERHLLDAVLAGCSGLVTKDRAFDDVTRAIRAVHRGDSFIPSHLVTALLPSNTRGQRWLGSDLSARESEVLTLTAEGLSNRDIADRLVLSVHTVRNHIQGVLSKLQAHSRLEAVIIATREGLLSREPVRR
jgi:two-component system NarL family response regulator